MRRQGGFTPRLFRGSTRRMVGSSSWKPRIPSIHSHQYKGVNNIPGLNNAELYYIKRLAGKPEDTLYIADNKLYRNGKIIEGSDAFDKNNQCVFSEKYYGYLPQSGGKNPYSKPLNQKFTVPEGFYYALGDNSGNSFDSRGWGCVPANDAVGRASFILYPLSELGQLEHFQMVIVPKSEANAAIFCSRGAVLHTLVKVFSKFLFCFVAFFNIPKSFNSAGLSYSIAISLTNASASLFGSRSSLWLHNWMRRWRSCACRWS